MNYYLKVVRDNYANFEGRARREEYWMFSLFNVLITIVLLVIMIAGASIDNQFVTLTSYGLLLAYVLLTFIPGLAVTVRRLHDTNHSGWMYLVSFIPFIGGIWLFILLITEGTTGENQYGEDPKALRTIPLPEWRN